MTLKELINDCGGTRIVAKGLGCTPQNVHKMIKQGHLPLSELNGRTRYSDQLARMQKTGALTAAEIRRLGMRL
ncbi:hypothetical protein R6258_07745 [Halomonas sp. HP20-15]|uniref:hypothetical protein n=1 Tax=Halomonas sp. HP20-15 TaxID=3085901 RepID=UPI00298282A6|nr:hypothetical protein [Halomonas sp. HP20-15]MDW5376812.1 hypothetical protein [Halomonas sp. HP20-15]